MQKQIGRVLVLEADRHEYYKLVADVKLRKPRLGRLGPLDCFLQMRIARENAFVNSLGLLLFQFRAKG
jgi:hypothetical protein